MTQEEQRRPCQGAQPTYTYPQDTAPGYRGNPKLRRHWRSVFVTRRRWSRELDALLHVDPAVVVPVRLVDYRESSWTWNEREAAGQVAA